MIPLYARKQGERCQTLREHCQNAAALASADCAPMRSLMRLCGLLHDLGKATRAFQRYLLEGEGARGSVEHSLHGAAYAWARWHKGDSYRMLTAELIVTAVASHHGRLPDVLNADGEPYARPEAPPDDLSEALEGYFTQVVSENELDALFEAAVEEARAYYQERVAAACADLPDPSIPSARMNLLGLWQREVYGRLIDADRWDAYRFEADAPDAPPAPAPWERWQRRLEATLASFAQNTAPIARYRARVADECLRAAGGPGVYRLCVPTGGGKTFSSLRFALESAQKHGYARIVYAAPYKAILEQTARELRAVLKDEPLILEHHGDVTPAEGEESERYQLLTQRWDAPLILTTTVQLLNTLFLGRSACARRFGALRGAILILDEVQSVPMRCVYPLNLALRYLARCAGCAVVLCTATQPLLERAERYPLCAPVRINPDEGGLYEAFRRVRLQDRTARETDAGALAAEVCAALPGCISALCVMNTKATAQKLSEAFRDTPPEGTPLFCLTTALCPAHRLNQLDRLRALLTARKPVVCVSTQLIEAGVDISFGLAVRSLCALPSAAQTAGRCNRHGERTMGELWLVRMRGESLRGLAEIAEGQSRTQSVLDAFRARPELFRGDPLSPEALERYFLKTLRECEPEMCYPLPDGHPLLELLSGNESARAEYQRRGGRRYARTVLAQAFRTAGRSFHALDADTESALVPYGKGAELIERIARTDDLRALRALLREAQPYAVAVYPHQLQALDDLGALRELPFGRAVEPSCYDDTLGLVIRRREWELLAL